MRPNPKIKRQKDKAYLEYIKNRSCLVSDADCLGDVTYHHTKGKMFDYLTVPLCVRHHIPGVHTFGADTFQERYNIDFKIEIVYLLKAYPNQNEKIEELLKKLEENVDNKLKQRMEGLELALKVISAWAAFDISHCKNDNFVAALIPQDVIKLCDKVLKG